MKATQMHREDVKALLRKRYGSIERFSAAKDLASQAVRDLLRGKSRRALAAVAAEIGVAPDQLVITYDGPFCGVSHSNTHAKPHRLNGGAK